jgi:hypothetical protein
VAQPASEVAQQAPEVVALPAAMRRRAAVRAAAIH